MKFHKTPQKQREVYHYEFYDADGRKETYTIRPGEDGVTEVDIKRVHALDDSEVYYNLKSRHPSDTDQIKAQKAAWRERYAVDFELAYGYRPCAKDISAAVGDAFPENWLASLDELMDGDDGYGDKSAALADLYLDETSDASLPLERLQEIITTLPAKEQIVYQRVLIEGEKKCAVAADLGLSDVRVSQIAQKIKAFIANDDILKSFFR